MEFVDDTMFYREGHRRIFRAMVSISERGDVVDPLTLSEELGRSRRARGERRQGLHRISRRRGADRGEHRVSREDRAREGAPSPADRSLDGDRHRGVRAGAPATELLDDAEHKIFQVSQQRGSEGLHAHQGAALADDGAHRGAPARRRIDHRRRERVHRSRRAHVGLPTVRSDHRRGATVDGKDGVRAQHRAARSDREQRPGGVLLARNEQGVSSSSACSRPRGASMRRRLRKGMLHDDDFPRLATRRRHSEPRADLDRRHAGHHAARDALEGAAPQDGTRHRDGRRRLPAAHAGSDELREPAAGDQPDLALAQGARARS